MSDPKMFARMKLVALLFAALLLWTGPTRHWAAGLETASFRLSLSVGADAVRFRTVAFDSGQPGWRMIVEGRR